LRQEKRHKLQLFYEILYAIKGDTMHNEVSRPTHVQHFIILSCENLVKHFDELEEKGMIHRVSGLVSVTAKGKKFIEQYDQLISLIESAGV
jgi:predicted transcriptional regulator